MTGKTHLAFGAFIGASGACILLGNGAAEPQAAGYAAGAALGSLVPDIDHTDSTLGRRLPFLSYPINAVFGHRGFVHSPLFLALLCLIFYKASAINPFTMGLVTGMAAHLTQDMCTAGGLPLFWPLFRGQVRVFPWKTGHPMNIVATIILGAGWVLLLKEYGALAAGACIGAW